MSRRTPDALAGRSSPFDFRLECLHFFFLFHSADDNDPHESRPSIHVFASFAFEGEKVNEAAATRNTSQMGRSSRNES